MHENDIFYKPHHFHAQFKYSIQTPFGVQRTIYTNQVRSAKLVSDSRPPSLLFYFEIVGEL